MLLKKSTSYQRRTGRLSSSQKQEMSANQFLIKVSDIQQIETIFQQYNACIVEIGFGMGDHLLSDVKNNPNNFHIGIDLYQAGIARVLKQLQERNDTNCRVICADACDAMSEWPSESIDRINIHHPDPWPKKRHHKRRLIHREFIQSCMNALKINGVIDIITDDANYFTDIKETISTNYDTESFIIESNRQATSKYGHKATSEGRSIQAITLRKK